ncbi:conserved virulence factor C family protein [Paenisporosarcina cavernae]|uniref:Virulence factor n=1 Tax=Paenisporosarcina cavernae TaxID=2320858 RepID=A0A385YT01_9BACL|nr:virulence factor [Paenisporosarcina cavernae]AYC29440.1 virulence factor [Paenisporosarcina cavernae]
MKIVTIEPTPSPNTMKIVLDTELPFGKSYTYTSESIESFPELAQFILSIDGVKSIFHVADFFAVERNAKKDWETIIREIQEVERTDKSESSYKEQVDEHFGEVQVHVQQFKNIPLQVKVFDQSSEHRIGLDQRFIEAMNEVHDPEEENYLLQRQWKDFGIRYGSKEQIATEVKEEIETIYTSDKLSQIIQSVLQPKEAQEMERVKVTIEDFKQDEWKERFRLLDSIKTPDISDLDLLQIALQDNQMAIRRLAVVYIGMLSDPKVVPLLELALKDKSAAVRRTAGDCMSDIGFPEFEKAMQLALFDKSKIVRWRAAMFLYETGTEDSLQSLENAKNDAEYEVKLQVRMALARIKDGEDAMGSVWKQMTESRNQ